ncbi:ITA7 protein, partial [Herpetotheres cachinnans]|nr:ITA7 protein [Herpetotheres cachinnans]
GADGISAPRGADGTAIFAVSDQKDVALEIHVTNLPSDPAEPQRDGDDAHEALLTATFPPELPYSALRPYDGRAPSVRRGPGGGKGGTLGVVPRVLVAEGWGGPGGAGGTGMVLRVWDGVRPGGAEGAGDGPGGAEGWRCVAVPPQLFFGGVVRGESAMRRESQVGSAVRFEVTVANRGQSLKTLGSAFLTLLWPHEISNGKWLLYPLHLELVAPPGQRTACSPPANPLRLALVPLRQRGAGMR